MLDKMLVPGDGSTDSVEVSPVDTSLACRPRRDRGASSAESTRNVRPRRAASPGRETSSTHSSQEADDLAMAQALQAALNQEMEDEDTLAAAALQHNNEQTSQPAPDAQGQFSAPRPEARNGHVVRSAPNVRVQRRPPPPSQNDVSSVLHAFGSALHTAGEPRNDARNVGRAVGSAFHFAGDIANI